MTRLHDIIPQKTEILKIKQNLEVQKQTDVSDIKDRYRIHKLISKYKLQPETDMRLFDNCSRSRFINDPNS
jgi:hypothetical protein